jgi:Kef-type K+ transport system membrane component KefB
MPAAVLLLQLAVITVAARVFGWLFQRIRQPVVVGEMVAGIVLGPSLLGYVFPAQHAALFPGDSLAALTVIAQTGVILFMFVVGMRVELRTFRRHSRAIAVISSSGIMVPFALGGILAIFLYDAFGTPAIPRLPFILFIATAMSVTAFPVLARIIVERRLDGTVPGDTALVCAAINDAVAWALAGSVAGVVAGGEARIPLTVHGVFVAFVGGSLSAVLMPRLAQFLATVEAPASRLLLPVFFAFTGLRTDLRLLSVGEGSWIWCTAIVIIATGGKLGGTALAAVAVGMSRRDALTLGALMNTRGLMELVILNIGYELGLLPPEVFAMMVVMALVTTCAAGPLVDRWSARYRRPSAVAAP